MFSNRRRLPPGARAPFEAGTLLKMQAGLTAGLGLLCLGLAGVHAAVSAWLGGLVVTLPNLWFAFRLGLLSASGPSSGPGSFFVGEVSKVLLTAVGLTAVVRFYPGLVWPALIAGMIVALKSYWLILMMERNTHGR